MQRSSFQSCGCGRVQQAEADHDATTADHPQCHVLALQSGANLLRKSRTDEETISGSHRHRAGRHLGITIVTVRTSKRSPAITVMARSYEPGFVSHGAVAT